jgi:hypothetical protein
MIAHTVETCGRENIDNSAVCDYVSTYTYDLLAPVMTSNIKIKI